MHELDITRNIVAAVGEAAKGRRVRRVTLEVEFAPATLFSPGTAVRASRCDGKASS